MAATRENVLAAIVKYVEDHGRRAPAKAIADIVGDKLPVVQGIIKDLVSAGSIESSRGRNGGAKPSGQNIDKVEAAAETAASDEDMAAQFAALVSQLEQDAEAQAAVG